MIAKQFDPGHTSNELLRSRIANHPAPDLNYQAIIVEIELEQRRPVQY
jgi:hypothetical protein